MAHVFRRVTHLMSAPTRLYKYKPSKRHPTLYLYKFLVMILTAYLFINVGRLVINGFKAGKRFLKLLLVPDHVLILITFFSFLLLALGESGEESRFLVSLLPLLAMLPVVKN